MRLLLLLLIAHPAALWAATKTPENSRSPNAQFEIILEAQDDASDGYAIIFRATAKKEPPLFSITGGHYVPFALASERANFRLLWSPSSRYVALFYRGTKRSGNTTVYRMTEDTASPVEFPDLSAAALALLKEEPRSLWIRPEVWLPAHQLLLSIEGEANERKFRFIAIVRTDTGALVSIEQDQTLPTP